MSVLESLSGSWSSIWGDVTGTQPALDREATLACGVLALLVVVVPRLWLVGRHVVTIAHEGAHGVAALLSGPEHAHHWLTRHGGIAIHDDGDVERFG